MKDVGDVSSTELKNVEQLYLDIATKEKDICYNVTFIAGGGNLGDVVNEKIKRSLIGKNIGTENHWFGKGYLQEGNLNHFYGKKHSIETKEIIAKIKKSSDYLKGENNPKADRKVYRFININTKECFVGTRHAFYSKHKNISSTALYNVIKGNRKHHKYWTIKPENYIYEI